MLHRSFYSVQFLFCLLAFLPQSQAKTLDLKTQCQLYFETTRLQCMVDSKTREGHFLLSSCSISDNIIKRLIRHTSESVMGSRSAEMCSVQNIHQDQSGKAWASGVTHTSFGTTVFRSGNPFNNAITITVVGVNGKKYIKKMVGLDSKHEFDGKVIPPPSDEAVAVFVEGADGINEVTDSKENTTPPRFGEYLRRRLGVSGSPSGSSGVDR